MASRTSNIMFLLGAGASTKADIDGIGKMSETFMNNIADLAWDYAVDIETSEKPEDEEFEHKKIVEAFCLLQKIIGKKSNKDFNIETLLEALVNLESQEHILYDILTYSNKISKYDKDYMHLKIILMKFIRKECENIGNINYLHPLTAFIRDTGGLDIFTLNYDGTIEKMCKENNITYTDGFSEEWDSKLFEEEKYKIRLHKLHGSLYWFKTEMGKYIKLPIKYIEVEKLMYFMDEKITETLIWPMITKDYSTGPFPWMMEIFREKLRTHEVCYVLGYSFRDDYIKKMVLDEMQNNSKLWLFIVDHHAIEIKKMLCENKQHMKERIIAVNDDIEKILLDRTLIEKNRHLANARRIEDEHKNMLVISKNIDSREWLHVFNIYRSIPHLDRIKNTARYIFDTYQSEIEMIPSLQWSLFDLSLRFGIKSYIEADYSDSHYWLNKFKECSLVLDWIMGRGLSKDYTLVTDNQIPLWAKDKDTKEYAKHFSDLNNMIDSLGKCMRMLDGDKEVQKIIPNYIKAMDIYTKNLDSEVINREVVITNLRDKGLVWSNLTSYLLFKVEKTEKKDSPIPIEEP